MKIDKNLSGVIRGALLAFAAIVLVELLLSCVYPYAAVDPSAGVVLAKAKLARQFPTNAQLLLLGDSSMGCGLNAKTLTQKTGLVTLNLAPVAPALLPGNFKILSEYLKKHTPPRAIILGVGYDYWQRDLVMMDPWPPASAPTASFDFSLRVWGLQTVPLLDWNRALPWEHLLWFLLPSQKLRGDWQTLMHQPLSTVFQTIQIRRRAEKSLLENQGEWREFIYGPRQSPSDSLRKKSIRLDAREHLEWMKHHSFTAAEINLRYLDKLMRLAQREHIEVMMLFPPLWEGLTSTDPAVSQFFKDYEAFMRDLGEKYPTLIFLNTQLERVPISDLEATVEHITLERSLSWSDTVSQEIKKHLPSQPLAASYET